MMKLEGLGCPFSFFVLETVLRQSSVTMNAPHSHDKLPA